MVEASLVKCSNPSYLKTGKNFKTFQDNSSFGIWKIVNMMPGGLV